MGFLTDMRVTHGIRSRRNRFIRPDLQLRFILLPIGIAAVVLVVDLLLCRSSLDGALTPLSAGDGVGPLLEGLRTSLLIGFLVSAAVAVTLSVILGIILSFPFAGPCYRIRRYFLDLIAGPWDRPCSLRRKDKLRDVSDAIEEGLSPIRGFLKANRDLLVEVDGLLEKLAAAAKESTAKRDLKDLLDRLRRILGEHRSRFPGPAAGEVRAAEPSPACRVPVSAR